MGPKENKKKFSHLKSIQSNKYSMGVQFLVQRYLSRHFKYVAKIWIFKENLLFCTKMSVSKCCFYLFDQITCLLCNYNICLYNREGHAFINKVPVDCWLHPYYQFVIHFGELNPAKKHKKLYIAQILSKLIE